MWRGDQLGSLVTNVVASGFELLDAQLPGGGWPCQSVTEILTAQASILEWRLLAPALRQVCARGESIAVVAPPKPPHLPGLRHEGIEDRHLIWVQAEAPAPRLWALEQLIKANACGAVVGWLPQVRQEQVRRIQVLAAQCDAPVFLFRPAAAASEASAAPLRLQARPGPDWELFVDIIKRKGPPLNETLRLPSMPGGLKSFVTPRLQNPSRLMIQETHDDTVVRLAPESSRRRQPISH